ncbi:MAG: sigma-70 family RNA polymerase sigma factor [Parcubacteria group bacterium]|nr:sigma-70 family RNA polymerase sigma factor [Parcubacteria group bacterium]
MCKNAFEPEAGFLPKVPFSGSEREIVYLHLQEGLTVIEIADRIYSSVQTVHEVLFLGLASLKKYIEEIQEQQIHETRFIPGY